MLFRSVEGGEGGSAGITINVWVIIVVVLALVTGGVIWAASSGDDKTTSSDTAGTGVDLTNLPVSQPISVVGDALSPYDVAQSPDPSVGLVAPLISGLDFQGDAIAVDPSANGPYMIVFLAHWCPHCNAEVPRLLDWKGSGAVPTELNVIGVATADRKSVV